jgi:outer membrane protein OmpA-like peptidoglycan-associated protein
LRFYLNKKNQFCYFSGMKFIALFVFLILVLLSSSAFAQEIFSPYYVVIGSFENEHNAQQFITYADEQNLPAVYAFNEARKIFYVYVRATQVKEVAYDILKRIHSNSVFKDAWVFNGVLSGSNLEAKNTQPPEKPPVSPPVEDTVKQVEPAEPGNVPSGVPSETGPAVETPKPAGKPFVFVLTNAATGSSVNGLVRLQESEKAMQFRGFNGNEKVYVIPPSNRSGKWYLVCEVVGFRKYKKLVNYATAQEIEGASVGSDQEVIIPLRLDRVRKGDYIEMDGVKFFHNTALLTPGSERELDELYVMMEENQGYQVRLHGHTNGKETRDIVSIGKSTDFFNPNDDNAKSHGSAKELSLLRAELVKSYLINKGIDASRIGVKGEGGTQMIFETGGLLGGMNDRVEVEITKHK